VGGASEPVRLLTLGVALWCVLAHACSGTAESTGTTQGNSRDRSVAGSRAEDEPDQAGAAGDASAPVASAGSAGMATMEPSSSSGGSTSGSSSGDGSNVTRDGGGEGNAGGATAPDEPPACGKQLDGTMCGPNMTPAGPEGARYFCSAGVIIAEAACPGPCDLETNACVQSGGTGGGSGDTKLNTLLRCRACYATQCRPQLVACDADPYCVAHLACYESCSLNATCYATCRQVFEDELLFYELDACVEESGCIAQCPAE